MSGPVVAPYGTWSSPLDADLVARAATFVYEARLHGDTAWWLELRPEENGRNVLVRSGPDGGPVDVTPVGFDVRTLVHEYGGGSYVVHEGVSTFANLDDQRLYRHEPGGDPVAITPPPPSPRSLRYADMDVSPDGRWIACVRERHEEGAIPVNELVVLPADGSVAPAVVATGSDFVASPRFTPTGDRIAWLRWDMPRMPWDGVELLVAPFADGEVGPGVVVAGGDAESIFQPAWSPDGVLHFVSDRTGWWNLHRLEPDGSATNLTPQSAEFGVPMWQLGYSTYAFLHDGRIVCASRHAGAHRLSMLDAATSELIGVDVPFTCFEPYVSASGSRICFLGSGPAAARSVVVLDVESREVEVLRDGEGLGVDEAFISVAEPIDFPTDDGRTAFACLYPPTNPGFAGPGDELPPLIVRVHGGPTSESTPALRGSIQYFTSRGFALVDVNYGGSTGYGREYRERLYGRWGVVDVDDCIAAARSLAGTGRADPDRTVVTGGSAGGYVVLAALAFHPRAFAAGTSYFGVADLEPFVATTHKFEMRYLDMLIGPLPEAIDLYRERSPIHRADDIVRPMLLLQGLEDAVVPPAQAEIMIEALERNHVPYAYVAFEGEQHGFRKAESLVRSFESELAFYGRVLGFAPADVLPPLDIRNLPD